MVKQTISYSSGWDLFQQIYGLRSGLVANKAYSKYEKNTQNKIKSYAKAILNCISGGDIINLLNDLLSAEEVAKLHPFDKVSDLLF